MARARFGGGATRVEGVPNGPVLGGLIDLLVDTDEAWVIIDHKSSPFGADQWENLADRHGGQLAASWRPMRPR